MSRSRKRSSAVAPLLWAFAFAAMLLSVSLSAAGATSAHAAEPIEDGGIIVFDECSIVSATVAQSDAQFTSVFWRFGPDADLGITSKQVGTTFLIGQVEAGDELILGIKVNQTGKTYQTGPGSRNPDGQVHALITGANVGFEDKALGEPNADFDYNDAIVDLTIEPCERSEQVTLTVEIDPASTGGGSVGGGGVYDLGVIARATASPGISSTFGGWSGDCNGAAHIFAVTMDQDRTCVALFLTVTPPPPPPTPTPTPTSTPTPPVVLPSTVGIDNTLVSVNPARVGEEVTFRVDVTLDVPAANTADVRYIFDDSELGYLRASSGGATLTQCSLSGAGVIDCAFGNVTVDFAYDLHFEALTTADDSMTAASLSSDPDADGAEAPIVAGPALANVDIIAITGSVPDTGDGSVATAGNSMSFQLIALLGAAVFATVAGAARLRTGARS